MDYILYIILSILLLGSILYGAKQLVKRISHNKIVTPVAALKPTVDPYDDFMCIMRADSSTLTSSRGVVITGRKLRL